MTDVPYPESIGSEGEVGLCRPEAQIASRKCGTRCAMEGNLAENSRTGSDVWVGLDGGNRKHLLHNEICGSSCRSFDARIQATSTWVYALFRSGLIRCLKRRQQA